MSRLLSLNSSSLTSLDRAGLREAVRESEGRVVVAETICTVQPLLEDITNAEIVAAMGADLLLINLFDVTAPQVAGLPESDPEEVIRTLQHLTGRPIGINLEPVGVPEGRRATAENARRAVKLGVQIITVTANPSTGADNASIRDGIQAVSEAVGESALVIGGRMHGAGVVQESGGRLIDAGTVSSFVEAGADVVLLPAPATVPGMTIEAVRQMVASAHAHGALAMTAIGTSQEGADVATIRAIALAAKQTGADMHHLGDAGFTGVAVPENVMRYSIAIRGIRHTYRRMAASVNR